MIQNNSDNVFPVTHQKVQVVEKIKPVEAVKAIQSAPADNKELPQEKGSEANLLDSAVRNLNEYVRIVQRELQFSIDEASGQMVIKVFDKESQEVIRQIPREEALRLALMLNDDGDPELINTFT